MVASTCVQRSRLLTLSAAAMMSRSALGMTLPRQMKTGSRDFSHNSAEDPQCTFSLAATPSWYGEVKTFTWHGPCDTEFEAVAADTGFAGTWCTKNHGMHAMYLRVKGCSPCDNLKYLSCANQDHDVAYEITERHSPDPSTPEAIIPESKGPPSWTFTMGVDDALVAINKKSGAMTDLHRLSATGDYKTFSLQKATGLHATDASWEFLMKVNGDLVAVNRGPQDGTGMTKVHILSADSDYKDFTLHAETGIHNTNHPNWQFGMKENGDLVCIHKGGSKTEVHILSEASDYKTFTLQTTTAFSRTDDNWEFLTKRNGDLVGVNRGPNTGSGMTEVHIASAASDYKTYTLHTGTALEDTSDNAYWQFAMKSNGDLVCILKGPSTGSGKTEVHILSGPKYQSYALQTGTGLGMSW